MALSGHLGRCSRDICVALVSVEVIIRRCVAVPGHIAELHHTISAGSSPLGVDFDLSADRRFSLFFEFYHPLGLVSEKRREVVRLRAGCIRVPADQRIAVLGIGVRLDLLFVFGHERGLCFAVIRVNDYAEMLIREVCDDDLAVCVVHRFAREVKCIRKGRGCIPAIEVFTVRNRCGLRTCKSGKRVLVENLLRSKNYIVFRINKVQSVRVSFVIDIYGTRVAGKRPCGINIVFIQSISCISIMCKTSELISDSKCTASAAFAGKGQPALPIMTVYVLLDMLILLSCSGSPIILEHVISVFTETCQESLCSSSTG